MERYVRIDGQARVVATGAEAVRDIHDLGVRYDGAAAAERQTRTVWSTQQRVTYAIASAASGRTISSAYSASRPQTISIGPFISTEQMARWWPSASRRFRSSFCRPSD